MSLPSRKKVRFSSKNNGKRVRLVRRVSTSVSAKSVFTVSDESRFAPSRCVTSRLGWNLPSIVGSGLGNAAAPGDRRPDGQADAEIECGEIREHAGAAGLRDLILSRRKRPARRLEAVLNAALHVQVPFAQIRIEAEGLCRNADLRAPARTGALRRGIPDAVPLGVVAVAARLDQAVVARAARVDRKDVSGAPVEERTEHDEHVIFVVEIRVAPDAEADDAGWIRIVAHDADREPRCVGHHAHRRAQCRRLSFLRIGLDELIDRRRRGPHRLVERAVDVETRRHHAGPDPRRLLRKRRRCHRDPGNEQGDRSPDYFQVTSMPKKCMTDRIHEDVRATSRTIRQ